MILISIISFSQKAETQTTISQIDTIKAALSRAQDLAKQGNTEEASRIYKVMMGSYPNEKEAVRGWIMINYKRTANAEMEMIQTLDQLGKQYPKNTAIIYYRMFLETEHGQNEEAMKDIEKMIQLQPDSAVNWVAKGQVLFTLKRYDEAVQAFNKANILDPKRPDVWVMKGQALYTLKRYDEAAKTYDKANILDPKRAVVWEMKAEALYKMGKLDDALISLNKEIDLVPASPSGLYDRACIYSLKGDKTKALADLNKAITLNPSFKQSAIQDEDFKSLYDDEEFKKLTFVLAVGQKAPDFILNDIKGNKVSLSSKIGPKLLLIDFWAGWCAPCRQENPNVLKIYNEFREKGFDIIGVSLDRTKDDWIKAINDDKLPWTQVSDLNYFNCAAAKLYDVASIPANFLLDEKGMIIAMNLRGETLYNKVKEILVPKQP
jgi:tetratricopeptide (TPR) repeat protein